MADIGADIVAQIVDDGHHHHPLITRFPPTSGSYDPNSNRFTSDISLGVYLRIA